MQIVNESDRDVTWWCYNSFADDDAGSHSIAGCYAQHDRPIRNTKIVDSIDFEVTIDNRHRESEQRMCLNRSMSGKHLMSGKHYSWCNKSFTFFHLASDGW